MRRRLVVTAAVVTACAAVVVGCDDGNAPPTTGSGTPSAATIGGTASPSASPTRTITDAERDAQAAGDTVVKYWAVIDSLAADPSKSLKPLDTVARDQARAQRLVVLRTYLAKGWVQTGKAVLTDVSPKKVKSHTYTVTACVDVSDVDFVDKNGESQVDPGRPDKQRFAYTVTDKGGPSYVIVDTLKGTPC